MDLNLWKNKEELKKYLENLGVEYRYGCFEENNPEACHLLAEYLATIEKARSKAAQVHRTNCDENKHGLSCDCFGRMAYRGQGLAGPDHQLALHYFIKGCDLDDPRACYHGGQMLGVVDKKLNKSIPPDPDKALEMLQKACLSRKEPAACTLVHSYYLRGVHGKPADMKLAAHWAEIACDQDEPISCSNLSKMYHLGDGVQADQEKSKHYMKRAKEIFSSFKKDLKVNENAESDL